MRITEYAAYRDCGLQAVQFAIARGRIRHTDNNLIDSDAADAAWEESTQPSMSPHGFGPERAETPPRLSTRSGSPGEPPQRSVEAKPGIPYADARALREVYEVQKKQLDLEVRRGLLVNREEVEREAFKLFRVLRDACFNLPPRLAPQLAAETDSNAIHEVLEAELHRIFQDFAEGRLT
jgi:hypothetical protein